jgi:hypothetical protein
MGRYKFSFDDGRVAYVTVKEGGLEAATAKFNDVIYPDMMTRADDVGGKVQGPEGDQRLPAKKVSSYAIPGNASSPPWPTPYAIPRDTPPGAAPITEPPPGPQGVPGGAPRTAAPTGELKPLDRPPVSKLSHEEQLAKDRADTERMANPATGMPWYQKGAVGFQSGLRNAISGAKDLVGLEDDEGRQERIDREKRNKPLGNWGTAGELLAEGLITAPIGGGVANLGGKVLTRAIPELAQAAQYGGKVLNLGKMTEGAVQGATTAGLVGHADDKGDLGHRLVDSLEGAAGGAAAVPILKVASLPFKYGASVASGVKNAFWPSQKELELRAVGGLTKTLGKEGLAEARTAMEGATPGMIPETSASMSQNPRLGALERGARRRGLADFNSHDERVARSAWDALHLSPDVTDAGEALRGTFMRDGVIPGGRQFGTGAERVPDVRAQPLRQALAKTQNGLSPDERDIAINLADDLSRRDVVKYGQGAITPDVSKWTDHIPMVLGAFVKAKGWGMANMFLNKAKVSALNDLRVSNQDRVMKEIDEALLDPDKFMKMVDDVSARVAGNEPLTAKQAVVKKMSEGLADALASTTASAAGAAAAK